MSDDFGAYVFWTLVCAVICIGAFMWHPILTITVVAVVVAIIIASNKSQVVYEVRPIPKSKPKYVPPVYQEEYLKEKARMDARNGDKSAFENEITDEYLL